jgi:hypothetical protein
LIKGSATQNLILKIFNEELLLVFIFFLFGLTVLGFLKFLKFNELNLILMDFAVIPFLPPVEFCVSCIQY